MNSLTSSCDVNDTLSQSMPSNREPVPPVQPVIENGFELLASKLSSKLSADLFKNGQLIEYEEEDQIVIEYPDYTSEVEVGATAEIADDSHPPESEVTVENVEPAKRSRATSEDTLYCVCRQPWDPENVRFMIECTHCKGWFHGSCVGIPETLGSTIDSYHCKVCEPTAGPIIYKDPNEKPIKAGTKEFLRKLKEKEYVSADKVVSKLSGDELTITRFYKNGFSKPILVMKKDGLDMKVPKETFTVREVEAYVGSDLEVDVIDVERQTDVKMSIKEFCDYFTYPARNKLYNLISLEFSKTRLDHLVQAPAIVRKLDWINQWKIKSDIEAPSVAKYCLISAKESFTDFHIDFGGTSVWYHVLWGEKVFYLVEPTPTNLSLYQRWMSSNPQDYETFFADTVDYCYQIVLKAGQTLFIPTGWIHAVLTTEDSLVFGGNFLHHLNIDLQLKVYEIEKDLQVPNKYLFPHFETCTWFAAQEVIDVFHNLHEQDMHPTHFVEGLRALGKALRSWIGEDTIARELVPRNVGPSRLIKQITKIVRRYDRKQRESDSTAKNISGKASQSECSQMWSNPSSPDFISPSSCSESEVFRMRDNSRLSKRRRKVRVSDSSTSISPTYSVEPISPLTPCNDDSVHLPIKIKIRRTSVSDTSGPASPASCVGSVGSHHRYGRPMNSFMPVHKTPQYGYMKLLSKDMVTKLPSKDLEEDSQIGSVGTCSTTDESKGVDSGISTYDETGQQSINTESDQGKRLPNTVYPLQPEYEEDDGRGHYITHKKAVELVESADMEALANSTLPFPCFFKEVEPDYVDNDGNGHYISRKRIGILEEPGMWYKEIAPESFQNHDFEAANEMGNTEFNMNESNEESEEGSEDELVMDVSCNSDGSDSEQYKHRRHRHKHRHHKKLKKSKSRDSSGSRHKKHKKHKKHKHHHSSENKHADGKSLDFALAGTLEGMETLFNDANYKERLAETAKKSSTSESMKEAFAEIIENESLPLSSRLRNSKAKAKKLVDPWAEENIQKVHQDNDYIYLPLAGESSDEASTPKRRKLSLQEKRKEKAELWSPNVKVGQITRRESNPTRANAKVLAVEKGLENAAALLASLKEETKKKTPVAKKTKKNDLKLKVVKPSTSTNIDNTEWQLVSQGNVNPGPSTSAQMAAPAATTKKPRKGKKGFMTPKQRLGKILKLGKLKML